jgi:protein tyrosine/serine phosphatase
MVMAGRWVLSILAALVVIGGPLAYYRSDYANYKRLREVSPGKFYRSGQLTASGLREAIQRFKIKTVINLQEENTDPYMPEAWLGKPSVREIELCQSLGVKYYNLFGGETIPNDRFNAGERPKVIDQYLLILDDPANYPILIHCKAGLHRTGLLTAVYRLEYEKWPERRAVEELRANGFGTYAATTENIYLKQYIAGYKPGLRKPVTPAIEGRPLAVAEGAR